MMSKWNYPKFYPFINDVMHASKRLRFFFLSSLNARNLSNRQSTKIIIWDLFRVRDIILLTSLFLFHENWLKYDDNDARWWRKPLWMWMDLIPHPTTENKKSLSLFTLTHILKVFSKHNDIQFLFNLSLLPLTRLHFYHSPYNTISYNTIKMLNFFQYNSIFFLSFPFSLQSPPTFTSLFTRLSRLFLS